MSNILRAMAAAIAAGFLMTASAADVVFKDKAGRVLTRQDLQKATGKFAWEIQSDRDVPMQAKALHEKGRAAGQKGDYTAAIRYFQEASGLAPSWPYPIYDAAFTFLLQGDSAKALESYERVNTLAPRGFFTAKTAAHALRKEKAQKLPAGIYLAYLSLEWKSDPIEKGKVVDAILQAAPGFAPAWKAKALLSDDNAQRLAFLEKGLAADPDPETYGFLRINQALALSKKGERAKAIEILGSLALDPKSPVDIEALAKHALALNF